MKIGIVGSEGKKFTRNGMLQAKWLILSLIQDPEVELVISGDCHLGGIDLWARQASAKIGKPFQGFPPKNLRWETGYKPRNLQIAKNSDIVHCITVDQLPEDYDGMTFPMCYHCGTKDHVKSGGCWTMKKCIQGQLHIIKNY